MWDKCRRSHFWVVIAPGLHVMFRFSAKHDNKAADALVVGYEGYLVADAHAVYDHLSKNGRSLASSRSRTATASTADLSTEL